jgi:serine phosphatase RsbU (regulator of sigma subunit)
MLAAVVWIWRRTGPADPPYGRPLLVAAACIAAQMVVFLSNLLVEEWIRGGVVTERLGPAAGMAWLIQFARTALLLGAAAMWLRIVKPRLERSWRGVVLAIAILFIAFLPDVPVIGSLLIVIVLLRVKWTSNVYGWRRFLGFLLSAALFVASTVDVSVVATGSASVTSNINFSDTHQLSILTGNLPESVAATMRLAGPLDTAVHVLIVLLRLQLLIATLQFLVFPIQLRGISLKRRFTVTMILYRVIPGFLGFAVLLLGVYFGLGLHKARLAQEAFSETLHQNLHASGTVIESTRGWPRTVSDAAVIRQFEAADHWNGREGTTSYYTLKRVRLSVGEPDSTGQVEVSMDSVLHAVATPGTPPHFMDGTLFDAGKIDSVFGMTVADTVLYLASARSVRDGNEATVAEVYLTLDTAYLDYIARLIQADIRFRAIPDMFIGETSLTMSSDSTWADSSFTVTAKATADGPDRGFFNSKHFLARSFIPLSNWNRSFSEGIHGAADLRLVISPNNLARGLVSNMLVFSSNAVAVAIFATILLLFLIAEYSAARTGRSIIRGILDDIKGLAEAARKFGEGDLAHRIEVRGSDEFGMLSSSFNTMAENIEENQELLLEKERLEADLTLARDIQQRMLPQSPPVLPGLDVAGLSIPSREVGGDLFYFLPVTDGRLGLTIGDVSGKSVPAALLMSNVLAALKSEARLVENEDEILTHLNGLLVEQVEPGQFITFFYGVLDREARKLGYACAGHNPALLVRRDGTTAWLREAGVPLGVLPENIYVSAEVDLLEGDVLVLYSDGVTEAEKPSDVPEREESAPPEPDFYDDHRLEAAVRKAREDSAAGIIRAVVDSVNEFTGGADLSDDLTLVVVKISPMQT